MCCLPCRARAFALWHFFVSSIHGPSLRGSSNSLGMAKIRAHFPLQQILQLRETLGVGEPECGAHVEVVKEVRP